MAKNRRGSKNKTSAGNNSSNTSTTTEQRASKKPQGTVAIETVKQVVELLKPYELSKSQRLKTFQLMLLDDAVSSAFQANSVFIEKAFANFNIKYDNNSERSTQAKDFLKWNLNNLKGQTPRSIARSAAEFKRDGVAPFEKVFERGYGDWATTPDGLPSWKVKKLNYIHPLTLYPSEPFTIEQGGSAVTHMNQSQSAFKNSGGRQTNLAGMSKGYISIPIQKLVLMTYAATDSQPFGSSPFEACYTAWREKVLLQDLTTVGVSKDLSGTPVLLLPSNILNDAAVDPSSQAGVMVEGLKQSMANLHTGDQASMILPSDTFNEAGSGAREFEIKFLGVDGTGKQFDLEALVEQRKKAIYNVFGAANLIAADSSGGYNQLEGQNSLHSHFIERDIAVIEEAWNKDIIPQLFRMNEWDLTEEELPKIKAGELTPVTIEEFSKGIQRVGAVGLLPRTPEVINEILSGLGMTYRVDTSMTQDELDTILTDATTRSGDGMSTGLPSGTGDSNGNNSATNSDNKA